jgi:segregation and condensation protein A
MDYNVQLETFQGPLDLLLFLVKRHEIDIFDIPIAQLAEQFLAYLNILKLIDVEWAGEFLVMAATLMEIKSRMLLPRMEEDLIGDDDPRLELVKQLIEYKKYKEAAALLEDQAEKQLARLPRVPPEMPQPLDAAQQPLRRVELWDLVSAFGRLMRETNALLPRRIVMDETPIQVHMERIMELLAQKQKAPLSEIFQEPRSLGRFVGLFLASLELIKGNKIQAEQAELFGEIWLKLQEN